MICLGCSTALTPSRSTDRGESFGRYVATCPTCGLRQYDDELRPRKGTVTLSRVTRVDRLGTGGQSSEGTPAGFGSPCPGTVRGAGLVPGKRTGG